MKRIISLILLMIFSLGIVSCNNTVSTQQTTRDAFSDYVNSLIHGDGFATTAPVVIPYPYLTFEEMCELATDVVVGRIIAPPEKYGEEHWKYTIEISETVVGELSGVMDLYISSHICQVVYPDGRLGGKFSELGPETYYGPLGQNDYLFILTKDTDVYSTPQINYTWSCATVILLDDLKHSDMYGTSLATHIAGIDVNNCTREEMIEYVRSITADNPPGRTLSDAVTLEEIVADAPAILQVKPTEMLTEVKDDLKHTEIWHCEIVETLKGDTAGEIQVMFFEDTVEAGEEYIVAVEMIDGDAFYSFITKDSLRPVSEKEEIKAYIDTIYSFA